VTLRVTGFRVTSVHTQIAKLAKRARP